MSAASGTYVDNRESNIGQQVIAERVFFGGEQPEQLERDALRQQIEQCFAQALQRGELGLDARVQIDAALQRLLGWRGEWIEAAEHRLASIAVSNDERDDLRLPLELLRPPTGSGAVVVRCALAETKSVSEAPRAYPEGGRIVLATADAGGPIPDEALLVTMREACRAGLHLASGSEHDRKRGAFDPALDHLPRASRRALRQTLGPRDERPGAAVLVLACHVREGGVCLHGDAGEGVIVGAEALAAVLEPHAAHLRLVVLLAVADRSDGDPGRAALEAAMALHHRGMAAVVAPRVPLATAALPDTCSLLVASLLGDANVGPASLELALARANARASTEDGSTHLGLRLFARESDGNDTRPLVIRPYRGLSSFDPEHGRFYVGRENETQQAIQRLVELHEQGRPRLLLLVGASGVGKSSLVKAGIVPALAAAGWAAIITRPTQSSLAQLRGLVAGGPGGQRLVVVDQLEKLFTEAALRPGAGRYLQCLWSLAAEGGTTVIATLRVDALELGGDVKVDAVDGRTLEQLVTGPHTLFVHHLEAAALRRAIVEPARSVGLELEAGLADRLSTETLAEPGALPMLELALDQLWQRREGRLMVVRAYEGGLAAMLVGYANACVARLPSEQAAHARRILVRVATGPVVELATWRRRSTLATLRPEREERQPAFDAALAALVEARLVVRGDLGDVHDEQHVEASEQVAKAIESIDLSHELLLRHWQELHQWIEDAAPRLPALRDLERWVDEWNERNTLLTPQQLAYVDQARLSVEDDDLNGPTLALIGASRRAARRKQGLRRALFAGVGATALAFAGLSYVAVTQRNLAREQARVARAQTQLAEERLAQTGQLVDILMYDVRQRLERFPQLRELSQDVVDHLQRIQAHVGATHDFNTQWNIGAAHIKRGDDALLAGNVDGARTEYRAAHGIAVELSNAHPSPEAQRYLSVSLSKLGEAEAHSGNLTVARELFGRDLGIVEELARADPSDRQAQRDLSRSLSRLGDVEAQSGNLAAALVLLQRDLDITEALAATDPDDAQVRHDLVVSLDKLGAVELRNGTIERARGRFRRALAVAETLAEADPQGAQARRDLANTLDNLGDVEALDGDLAAAHELFLRAYELRDELARADPQSVQEQRSLAFSHRKLGEVDVQAGNLESAREFFQRYRDTAEALLAADPRSAQARRDVSISLNMLGDVEVQLGELTVARELFQRSIQVAESLAKADPGNPQAQRDLFVSLHFQGDVHAQLGELASARSLLQRSVAIAESLAKADPHGAQARRGLALAVTKLGDVELEAGDRAAARDLFRRSLALAEELAIRDPSDARAAFDVVLSLGRLAMVAKREGDAQSLRDVVATANARLATMEEEGWLDGSPEQEEVRAFFRHTAEQLSREP